MGMMAIMVMWPKQFEQVSFPHPKETLHKIWLQSAKLLLSIGSLK